MSPQVEYLEAIVTCKGNYYAPDFPLQLSNLYSRLEELVFLDEKKSIILKKVEPWNSIRVTLKMPADAARRLKQLYEQPDSILKTLGILAVQLETDNPLKNYNCKDNSILNSLPLNTDNVSLLDVDSNSETVMAYKIDSSNIFLSDRLSHQISLSKNSKLDITNFSSPLYTSSDLVSTNEFTNPELPYTHAQNILSNKNLVSVNQNIASSSPLLVNLLKSPGTRNTQISNNAGLSHSDIVNQMSKKRKRNQPKNSKRFKQSIDLNEISNNSLMNQSKDVDNDFKNNSNIMSKNLFINSKLLESEVLQNKYNLIGNGNNSVFKSCTNSNSNFSSSIKSNLISQTLLDNSMFDNISASNFATSINTNIQTKTSDIDISNNSLNSNMILNINNILRLALPSTQSDSRIISANSEELKTSGINISSNLTNIKKNREDIFNLKTIKDLETSHRAKITDIFKPLLNGVSNLASDSSIGTILNKNVNILNGRITSLSQLSEITQNSNFLQNLSTSLLENQSDGTPAEKRPKYLNSKHMSNTKTINGCLPIKHQPICSTKQEEALYNKNLNLLFGNSEDINEQQNQGSSYNLSNIMPVNLNGEIVTPNLQQVTAVLKNLQKLKVQRPQQIEDPHRTKSNLTVAQLLEQVEIAKNNRSSPINNFIKNQKFSSNTMQSIPISFSLPCMQNNNFFPGDKANKYNLLNDQSIFYSTNQNVFQSALVSQKNSLDVFASVLNTSSTQSPLLDNFLTNCSSYPRNFTQSIQSVLKNFPNNIPPVSPNLTLGINEQTIFKSSNQEEFLDDFEDEKLRNANFTYTTCSNSNFVTTQDFLNPDTNISAKETTCDEEDIKTMIASFYEAANLINKQKSANTISTDFIGIELGADDEANINDIIEMKDYDEDIEKLVESNSSIGDDDLITENGGNNLVNNIDKKCSQFNEYENNKHSKIDDEVISYEIKDQPSHSKQESDNSQELLQDIKAYKIKETSENIFSNDLSSFKENIVGDMQSYKQNNKNYIFVQESVINESSLQDAKEILRKKALDICDLKNDISDRIDRESFNSIVRQDELTTDLLKKCDKIFDCSFGDNKNTQSEEMEVSFENQEVNETMNNIQMSYDDCFEDKSQIYMSHNLLHDSNISKNHFITDWSDGRRLKKKKVPTATLR